MSHTHTWTHTHSHPPTYAQSRVSIISVDMTLTYNLFLETLTLSLKEDAYSKICLLVHDDREKTNWMNQTRPKKEKKIELGSNKSPTISES